MIAVVPTDPGGPRARSSKRRRPDGREARDGGARESRKDGAPGRRSGATLPAILVLLAISVGALAPAVFLGKLPAQTDWIYVYGPWLVRSEHTYNPGGGDSFYVYLPDRIAAINEWKQGRVPLWNPHVSAGVPFLGMQTANPLDPLILLELLLPRGIALGLAYAALLFVAGLGLVLFLRDRGVTGPAALAVAGLAFALNPYFVFWLETRVFLAGFATLPVALWALERVFAGPGARREAAVLALATGYASLGGTLQTYALFLALLLLRFAWLLATLRRKGRTTPAGAEVTRPQAPEGAPAGGGGAPRPLLAGAAILAGIALGILPLVAGAELLGQSTRLGGAAGYYARANFLHPRAVALWFSPEVFGWPTEKIFVASEFFRRSPASGSGWGAMGIVPLWLAVLALARRAGPRGERAFWGGLLGLTLAVLFAFGTPLYGAMRAVLPWLDDVDLLRGLFVVNLAGAVLAGLGAAEIGTLWSRSRARRAWLLPTGIFLVAGIAAVLAGRAGVKTPNSAVRDLAPVLLAGGALLALGFSAGRADSPGRPGPGGRTGARGDLSSWRVWALALLVVLELGRLHFRFNTFARPETDYPGHESITTILSRLGPPDYGRFYVSEHFRLLPPNTHEIFGLSSIRGYSNVPIARYRALLECAEGKGDMGNQVFISNIESPVYRLLGAAYLITGRPLQTNPAYEPVPSRWGDFYRRRHVLPRAFVVHDAAVARDEAEMRRFLSDPAFDPPARVYLEAAAGPLPETAPARGPERVEITSLEPTRVSIRAATTAPGVLVLQDPFYPGWRATVDGRRARILPAYWGLRGVALPAGEHEVIFEYRPWWLVPGTLLTLAALALSALAFLPGRRRGMSGGRGGSRDGGGVPPAREGSGGAP